MVFKILLIKYLDNLFSLFTVRWSRSGEKKLFWYSCLILSFCKFCIALSKVFISESQWIQYVFLYTTVSWIFFDILTI